MHAHSYTHATHTHTRKKKKQGHMEVCYLKPCRSNKNFTEVDLRLTEMIPRMEHEEAVFTESRKNSKKHQGWEIAQSAKSLLHGPEDLSSISPAHYKRSEVVCRHISRAGRQRQEDPWSAQPASSA